MTKKKKRKNREEFLINFLVILGLVAALLVGYAVARHLTEKRIAKHAYGYIENLADTLDIVCDKVVYTDPRIRVKYNYVVECYYSSAKSEYNSADIVVDNNGVVRYITYRLPAETNKSKEENYNTIDEIITRTNEAIEVSEADLSKIKVNKKLLDSFKADFDSKTYENKFYVVEEDNGQTIHNGYNPQDDETPYVPAYFEIAYRS